MPSPPRRAATAATVDLIPQHVQLGVLGLERGEHVGQLRNLLDRSGDSPLSSWVWWLTSIPGYSSQ